MALGCAFIFLLALMCWRRRARKLRAKHTAKFAQAKALNRRGNWLTRFGEKLFGHAPRRGGEDDEPEEIKLMKLRNAEEARHNNEMEKLTLIGAYEYSRAGSSHHRAHSARDSRSAMSDSTRGHTHRLSDGSLYSQVTGVPRKTAEPRQPVKNANLLSSRFSMTTLGSSRTRELTSHSVPPPVPSTDAEVYAATVRQSPEPRGQYWMAPNNTGSSKGSKNPFRR